MAGGEAVTQVGTQEGNELLAEKRVYTQTFESPEAAEAFLMMMPLDIYSARHGGRVMW